VRACTRVYVYSQGGRKQDLLSGQKVRLAFWPPSCFHPQPPSPPLTPRMQNYLLSFLSLGASVDSTLAQSPPCCAESPRVCVCVCVCVFVCARVCAHVYVSVGFSVCVGVCVGVGARTQACIHKQQIRTHTCTHTQTDTQTDPLRRPCDAAPPCGPGASVRGPLAPCMQSGRNETTRRWCERGARERAGRKGEGLGFRV